MEWVEFYQSVNNSEMDVGDKKIGRNVQKGSAFLSRLSRLLFCLPQQIHNGFHLVQTE